MIFTRTRFFQLLVIAIGLLVATTAGAQDQDGRGWNLEGTIADRDNTRVMGTVYDSQGNPLPKVAIWVANDEIPATRMRSRTRPDGGFLVRSIQRLYTDRPEDRLGIVLRLTFEKEGFRTLVVVAPVARNSLLDVLPVLWREGETPQLDGWCALVQGTVTSAGGKGVKNSTVAITSPLDPDLRVETETDKSGSYRVLIWNAPASLTVTAMAGGLSTAKDLNLVGTPRTDMVASVTQDLVLDS